MPRGCSWLTVAVLLLGTGRYFPTYTVEGSAIADLEVSAQQRNGPPGTGAAVTSPASAAVGGQGRQELRSAEAPVVQAPRNGLQQPFVDPAILSFTKPTNDTTVEPPDRRTSVGPQISSPVMIADSVKHSSPVSVSEPVQLEAKLQSKRSKATTHVPIAKPPKARERTGSSATATLTEPFDHMALNGDTGLSDLPGRPTPRPAADDDASRSAAVKGQARGKNKKNGNRKAKDLASQTGPGVIDMKDVQAPPVAVKKPNTRGKGWRQTPLTEEPAATKAETGQKRLKPKGRRSRMEEVNGWATEDATDIQDLGDFDFESNLSKFDKRRVFDDIRKEDTTADDERLVSFNRKVRPGTNGGKNLHYMENVLEPSEHTNIWKSEAGGSEDEVVHEELYSSGRGSRRATSRKPIPSRKGSSMAAGSSLVRGMSRMESPRPGSRISTAASPINGSVSSGQASLRLSSTNKPCASFSPLQMLEVEQLCISELGMTEDMLAENAGRGIAEVALTLLPHLATASNTLFLVGNHKSGARALAGARHLRNRGARTVVCLLGGERKEMLLESLRRQLEAYEKSGGWVVKWDEFQSKMTSASNSPPDVIIDALLGTHVAFDELRTSDQAIAFEMMRWSGRTTIPVLSVDIPSGLDGSTGEVTHVDGEPLAVQSQQVVCLGAPKTGVLQALVAGEGGSGKWQLTVADIGIPKGAWKKLGSRRRHGVAFGTEWVSALKFVEGVA
jgi:enhancer of mRNA-decapping protein 3